MMSRTGVASIIVALSCFCLVEAPRVYASSLVDTVIQQARHECQSLDNGKMDIGEQAVTHIDVTGDGSPDQIVDSSKFSCSSAASLFCGTGGCGVTVVANGTQSRFLAKAWKVVQWDNQPILLLVVHGSECGGNNLRRCYRATVWTESGFSTVGDN
jgi:hypothetical protein